MKSRSSTLTLHILFVLGQCIYRVTSVTGWPVILLFIGTIENVQTV